MADQPENGSELLDFVRSFASKSTLNVEEDLGYGYVRLRVTEAERRQARQDIRCLEDVVVELARNSRDAGAGRIYVASRKEKGRWRRLTVLDDGSGIPEPVHARIFESRVTSKVDEVLIDSHGIHGRGMALFSIRRAVDSIELFRTGEGQGSVFKVLVDLHRLPERKDQSSWPSISLEDGALVATGPHNVLRSLVELTFSVGAPSIYLGSDAEILATLFAHSREQARRGEGERGGAGTLWEALHAVREGVDLSRYAAEQLGLEVSERNALRVLEGDIAPVLSLNRLSRARSGLDPAVNDAENAGVRRKGRSRDPLARRFSDSDLDNLASEVLESAGRMGGRYFLKPDGCSLRRSGSRLVISISFDEE